MKEKTVLGEIEFTDEADDEEVHNVLEQLRNMENIIVYESGFSGKYEVARQED